MAASSALAVPAPLLSGGKGADRGSYMMVTRPVSPGLIVGGSSSFGSSITSQQIGISVVPSSGIGVSNDYFRRANPTPLSASDVPEPATIWLLGSGLGAALLLRKRQTR